MPKSRLFLVIMILGISALLAGACARQETSQTSGLEDSTWILVSYGEQGNLKKVLEGTEITATFDSAKKQAYGSAGANTYSGSYQTSGNKLSILELAWTEMYRLEPEGVMEQEEQYLKLFQAAEGFQLQDERLQIYSGNQILSYVEQKSGTLQGNVTIGPFQPVERPGEEPPVPCEVYEARKIMVYDEHGSNLINQVDIDCEGDYWIELDPGVYTVDINRIGIDHSSDVPRTVRIEPGKTIVLDIDIDTGIR